MGRRKRTAKANIEKEQKLAEAATIGLSLDAPTKQRHHRWHWRGLSGRLRLASLVVVAVNLVLACLVAVLAAWPRQPCLILDGERSCHPLARYSPVSDGWRPSIAPISLASIPTPERRIQPLIVNASSWEAAEWKTPLRCWDGRRSRGEALARLILGFTWRRYMAFPQPKFEFLNLLGALGRLALWYGRSRHFRLQLEGGTLAYEIVFAVQAVVTTILNFTFRGPRKATELPEWILGRELRSLPGLQVALRDFVAEQIFIGLSAVAWLAEIGLSSAIIHLSSGALAITASARLGRRIDPDLQLRLLALRS